MKPSKQPAVRKRRAANQQPPKKSLTDLYGIGKDLFQSLGGGEAFIRSEREAFDEDIQRRESLMWTTLK